MKSSKYNMVGMPSILVVYDVWHFKVVHSIENMQTRAIDYVLVLTCTIDWAHTQTCKEPIIN